MTAKADQVVDRAADGLRKLADRVAAEGGVASMLAEPLAEDAVFLRKLKPSLIAARVRGEAPVSRPVGNGAPAAPVGPQLGARPTRRKGGGPNPFLVVGAALVAGIVVAKLIDWRGHGYPRD
ncbi:MAG TPA: hypothetical protein VFL61_08905 [Gaiellaceae bacterium]|nr:hypothetical protein [Gaiellaceae bacterium]